MLRDPFPYMARYPDAGFLTTSDHLGNTTAGGPRSGIRVHVTNQLERARIQLYTGVVRGTRCTRSPSIPRDAEYAARYRIPALISAYS